MSEIPDGVSDEPDGDSDLVWWTPTDESPWRETYAATSPDGIVVSLRNEETGEVLLGTGDGDYIRTDVGVRITLAKQRTCSVCGCERDTEIEHTLPDGWKTTSAGRSDGVPVIEVLCEDCQ